MKTKPDFANTRKLMDDFEKIVRPWCEENEYSLHDAFENSRKTEPEKYKILSGLWSEAWGRAYLKSMFREHGGVLRK